MVGIKMKDMVFKNLGITKDYQQIMKHYKAYLKLKEKNNIKRMRIEKAAILPLLKDAKKDMERAYGIYEAAQKALEESQEPSVLYAPSQSKSYLVLFGEMKSELEAVESELAPQVIPPSAPVLP